MLSLLEMLTRIPAVARASPRDQSIGTYAMQAGMGSIERGAHLYDKSSSIV